ncbi:hypothetical protein MXD60_21915 [Frankia sp. AgB32]|nr:hypothetical protein [Frankia sp. AgB32]MCK9897216.1 hypothetical protein [Frankia sp. AgB32]
MYRSLLAQSCRSSHHVAPAARRGPITSAAVWGVVPPPTTTSNERCGDDRLTAPVAGQQAETLVEPFGKHSRVRRVAEAAELVVDRAAKARTEDGPSAAEDIKGGDLTGELLGAAASDRSDERAKRNR